MCDRILICGGHEVAISISSGTSVLSFCSFHPLVFISWQLQWAKLQKLLEQVVYRVTAWEKYYYRRVNGSSKEKRNVFNVSLGTENLKDCLLFTEFLIQKLTGIQADRWKFWMFAALMMHHKAKAPDKNLDLVTVYRDWNSTWFSSRHPENCQEGTKN